MTCSAAERARLRREVFLALLSALAIAVHALEALLPSPLPWLRPGLANVLTVATLFLFGGRAAWLVAMTRIGVGALLLGTLLAPTFFLSLAGGVIATGLMTAAYRLAGPRIGPVGVSLLGAAGHVTGQLLAAVWLLRQAALWRLWPVLLLLALGSGVFTGWLADRLLERLRRTPGLTVRGC